MPAAYQSDPVRVDHRQSLNWHKMSVSTPTEARRRAGQCLRQAQNKRLSPDSRVLLLDAAEAWIRLADEMEIPYLPAESLAQEPIANKTRH